MKARKKNIDQVSIMNANRFSKTCVDTTIRNAEALTSDNERKQRLDEMLCKSCYYLYHSRIGGQAMTDRDCGICDQTMRFSSTATDVVCLPCAVESALCKRCGADIDLKNKRNKKIVSSIR